MRTNLRSYGLDNIDETKPIYITEGDRLTRPSWTIPLRWLGLTLILGRIIGAIIFGFMITNLVTEKSSTEYPSQSIEEKR